MFTHIVMWKLKPDCPKDAAQQMKEKLEALRSEVPGVIKMEVGIAKPQSPYNVCLYSVFENEAAHDAYQSHPAHMLVKQYVHSVVCDRACTDYVSD